MYIIQKKSNISRKLAKVEVSDELTDKLCPKCGFECRLLERYPDKEVFKCSKCNVVSAFMVQTPKENKNQKVKRLGAITMVDKSKSERKSEPKDIESQKNIESPKKEESLESLLVLVRKSMQEKKVLNFEYFSATSKRRSTRSVEPYKLVKDNHGNIMLYAYCLEGEGIRVFKLNCISTPSLADYGYKPKWPLEDLLIKKDKDG